MVNTSDRPILVDGVRLDTLAWNITTINRASGARRAGDAEVPGRDGVLPSLNDTLDVPTFGLEMFVAGTDADGSVPAAGRRTTFRNNLDELVHLFGKRHALLEVTQAASDSAPRTNLLVNPSFETGTTGWVAAADVTLGTSTNSGFGGSVGTQALAVTTNADRSGTSPAWVLAATPVTPGEPLSFLFGARRGSASWPASIYAAIRFYDSGGGTVSTAVGPAGSTIAGSPPTFNEVSVSTTVPAGAVTARPFLWTLDPTPAGATLYVDRCILMKVPTISGADYFDGDTLASGAYQYAWTGTAHNSTSTRAPLQRRAWAKVVDSIQPDVNEAGSSGQFSVGLTLPYATWEDAAAQDWNGVAAAAQPVQEITTLRGATERTQDAILLVTGPATNPRVTDQATGAYVELQATVAAGQFWRVNVGTWATRQGAGLSLGSNDTTGTDAQALTRFGGIPSSAAFLPLVPVRDTGERRVKVQLTGSGFTAATRLSVRARRKYAL